MELIKVENLQVDADYGYIIKNINFMVKKNEVVVLVGRNGAGKTTLLKAVVGILKCKNGQVYFKGRPVLKWGDRIFEEVGLVLQNPDHQLFSLSVKEEIQFVLNNFKKQGNPEEILRKYDFELYKDNLPFYLSEGEKKKLCIISVLAHNPDVLILDEPFATLDWFERRKMFELISKIHKTVLVTTHDLNIAKKFSRVLLLHKGELIGDGSFEKLLPQLKRVGLVE